MTLRTIRTGPNSLAQGDAVASVCCGNAAVAIYGRVVSGVVVPAYNEAHHDDQDHDMTPLDQRGGDGV